jgi:hypothetical protein
LLADGTDLNFVAIATWDARAIVAVALIGELSAHERRC